MCSSALLAESHQLLHRARMIAEAPASQGGQLSHQHPDSRMPPGLSFSRSGQLHATQLSTLDQFGVRINLAIAHESDAELRTANAWCRSELKALQHGSVEVAAETPTQFRARIVREYEGVIAPVVAARERSSVAEVRRARSEHGRSTRYGHKVVTS